MPAVSIDHEQSTNHLVTTDRWGNVVSYTNTIEQLAGTGITVPGYGFLLNNELTDFDFTPLAPPAPDPNLPAAGKRPRSSMSPTIVLREGKPVLAVSSQVTDDYLYAFGDGDHRIAAPCISTSCAPVL